MIFFIDRVIIDNDFLFLLHFKLGLLLTI